MPDGPSGSGIDCKGIVRRSNEHQAVHDDGRAFKMVGIRRVKHPLRLKMSYVLGRNLGQARIAPSRVITVIGRPIGTDRLRQKVSRSHIDANCERAIAIAPGGSEKQATGYRNETIDIPHLMYRNVSRSLLLFSIVAPLLFAQQPAGQQLFSSSCAGCHGLDGRGGEHAPNIATDARIQRLGDADLVRIVHNGIPTAGMPAFGLNFNKGQIDAIVGYLRVLQGKHQTASVAGNAANGRVLFFGAGRCSECHMMNGKGGFLGPDLSGYGKSHSSDEIRESIINPNKNLDPRHGTIVVVTRSGQKYSGVLRNEDNFSIQMQTRDGNFHFFDKSELARIERQHQSLMPSQYGSQLTKAELDDLISYLTASAVSHPTGREEDDEQ